MQVDIIIEIPRGSGNKYELDHQTGRMRLDRALFTSMVFPHDYGAIENTLGEDGDPLDALVLLPRPTFPGVLIRARPISMLNMVDEHGTDQKILTVPDGDERFAHLRDLDDVAATTLAEIEHFFAHYKEIEHGKHVTTSGWSPRSAAESVIRAAYDRARDHHATHLLTRIPDPGSSSH